ncbi:hypothetical protein [Streptomyces sp. ME19-01-6]|uniref:hypothetical protein n=1 Tax=Streptomyces sp. ME19-01-6 TaxID=3028686 RepID=UPI0029B18B26|nr:hypothetical protein [Streptomyces sp. ME19-01-6]MDX3228196.1 hypothetical protein [Streptomyces sp. ME19-01-6]
MVRSIGHASRVLFAAVSVLLALFIAADCASVQVTHPQTVATASVAESRPAVKVTASSHDDAGADDCQGLRGARAPLTAPTPTGKPGCVCGCDAGRLEPRTTAVAPLTGRQAVPVSRSGELPVSLQIFRC